MTIKSDIDKRFEALRERQTAVKLEGQTELDRWRAELVEAKSAMQQEMANATAGFEAKLRQAEEAVVPLKEAQEAISRAITGEKRRAKQLGYLIGSVALGVCAVGAAVLGVALWLSTETLAAAETEAALIRAENAEAIAAARAEGEAALTRLTADLESREAALSADLTAMGAELAQAAIERNAARADLERFAELKRQIGLELVPYRNSVVIVVPQGETITRWGAPGLSNLARYNGRMFRVVRAD